MSALATILADRGHSVSGSDKQNNERINELKKRGVQIFIGQNEENIEIICKNNVEKPQIIISSAIKDSNIELKAGRSAKLEIIHRSELLEKLIKTQKSIVVSGSHGKTTTSTIIATLLALLEYDPSAIIGGLVPFYKNNGHNGKGEIIVAEADESDGSLVNLHPDIGVITNLELDHTDHYSSIEPLIKTIDNFSNNCKLVIKNKDCPILNKQLTDSYSWSIKTIESTDFTFIPNKLTGNNTHASYYENGILVDQVVVPLAGLHNLSNSLGAIAACRLAGIPFRKLKQVIPLIQSPKRRFEFRGEWKKRFIVDDYAHHPTEIKATIEMGFLTIKDVNNGPFQNAKRLVVIFQPHRYSRTRDFLNEFAYALSKASLVILAPIYGAGEAPIQGVNNQTLSDQVKVIKPGIDITIANDFEDLLKLLRSKTIENDLILNMGAGDINNLWEAFPINEITVNSNMKN